MFEGHCIRTVHAEANAICWAAKKGIALEGATLYVVGWEGGSCHRCAKLAWATGIIKIVTEEKNGNISIRTKLPEDSGIPTI